MTVEPGKAIEQHWAAPISVRLGSGHAELIHGPDDALYCLRYRWPMNRSLALDTARRRCLEARISEIPCEAAREAVIAAAIEARVLA